MNVLEDCITFLIWAAWILFNFYLKQKKKGFQSGATLKTPPSSPPMKEFTVGIQKQISLREAKTYLSEKNKNILKK